MDSNQVDEKVVHRLMNKIIIQENRNNKSRAKSDSQMVAEIKERYNHPWRKRQR